MPVHGPGLGCSTADRETDELTCKVCSKKVCFKRDYLVAWSVRNRKFTWPDKWLMCSMSTCWCRFCLEKLAHVAQSSPWVWRDAGEWGSKSPVLRSVTLRCILRAIPGFEECSVHDFSCSYGEKLLLKWFCMQDDSSESAAVTSKAKSSGRKRVVVASSSTGQVSACVVSLWYTWRFGFWWRVTR